MRRRCKFRGCNCPVVADQLCSGHYQQKKAGKSLKKLRAYISNAQYEARLSALQRKHEILQTQSKALQSENARLWAQLGKFTRGKRR